MFLKRERQSGGHKRAVCGAGMNIIVDSVRRAVVNMILNSVKGVVVNIIVDSVSRVLVNMCPKKRS